MSGFQLNISMSKDTVDDLAGNGSQLYVLRAVQSSDQSGRPVVWSVTKDFSVLTTLRVPAGLQVYTSFDSVTKGTQIDVAFTAGIQTGQTLRVGNNAIGTVKLNGLAGTVSILNTTTTPFACGLSGTDNDGKLAPFCAFPLFGKNKSTITPLDRILLQFFTDSIETGAVLEGPLARNLDATTTPGLLIDMTGASPATVSFDINQGWKWNPGVVNAKRVPPNAKLVDLLIVPPPDSL
jgi:hypothetical protein